MSAYLLSEAFRIINAALEGKKRPAVMFSGGKDSMVLLHLVNIHFGNWPVIFHKDPWFPWKANFATGVLRDNNSETYDWPPVKVSMWQGKGIVAFTNYYQIGCAGDKPAVLALPKNIVEPKPGGKWICGLEKILGRPTGTFNYPWDVVFIGHKSSDEDQIAGRVPLHADTVDNEAGPRLAFPLRSWTDKDVWDYTDTHGLRVQSSRYAAHQELPDKTYNPDYIEACIRCIDRRNTEPSVSCPKLDGRPVPNISQEVPYEDISLPYFGEKTSSSIESKMQNQN